MKRCPECNSLFPGTEKFCELDGTALIEAADNREFIELPPNRSKQTPLFIVATVGVVIGVLLALMFERIKPLKRFLENFRATSTPS